MRSPPRLLLFLALAPAAAAALLGGCSSDGVSPTPPGSEDAGAATPPDPTSDAGADSAPLGDGASDPATFTLLSLNLHCLKTSGTAYATNAARFAAIAGLASLEHVDVIAAQEVCVRPGEDARVMLQDALSSTTGATWSVASAFAHAAWEGTPDAADEHVAIFARASSEPLETAHRAQAALRRLTVGATIATSADVQRAGGPSRVRVHSVHLDHQDAAVRAAQAREVASLSMLEADDLALLEARAGGVLVPSIVAGDFNARPGTDVLAAMTSFGFAEASGSAGTTRIDHVFVHRSAPLAVADRRTVFTGAEAVSDHPGVLVRWTPSAGSGVQLTRVVARGSFGGGLMVRGDKAPLSWEIGWPAFPRRAAGAPASVALVTSELPSGAFAYKFLRDDGTWQAGPNEAGEAAKANETTPAFP